MGHLTGNLNPSWKPLKRNQAQTYNPSISSPALHHVLQHNNSLHFRAFSTSEFDPNIHDSFYRCMATSESGVALSRRVRVRAGDVFHFIRYKSIGNMALYVFLPYYIIEIFHCDASTYFIILQLSRDCFVPSQTYRFARNLVGQCIKS